MTNDLQHTINTAKLWFSKNANPFSRRQLKKFYHEFVEAGDICFDIGGGMGQRAEAWLALGAQVVCIEPQSDRMARIEKRFVGNNNLHIVRKAIGNGKRMGIMHVNAATPGAGTLTDGAVRLAISKNDTLSQTWEKEEPVEITTLDEIIDQHGKPDFCQINAKGYEPEILAGLTYSLKSLAFGYLSHAPQYALECLTKLEQFGDYEFKWTYDDEVESAAPRWVNTAAMRTVLRGFHTHERSGDIYARLRGNGLF